MVERRIGYASDKEEIINRLLSADESGGPFKMIADVLVFAAALGLKNGRSTPLGESQGDPIRHEVFDRKGYDTMMNLLALHAAKNPDILAESEEKIDERASIFEQYANGGLEILREELRGAVNPIETTILLLNAERKSPSKGLEGFDLTKLV